MFVCVASVVPIYLAMCFVRMGLLLKIGYIDFDVFGPKEPTHTKKQAKQLH